MSMGMCSPVARFANRGYLVVDTGRELRVGVAGLGFGAAVHIPVFQAMPGVVVEGIAGNNYEHATLVAKKFSIPHAFSSIDALLKLPLDAVSLALPPDQVYAAATKVIRAGLPVLCEKPLGMNAEQARFLQMQASELVTAMDFLFAEVDQFQELKYLIDTRQLGNLRHINVLWLTESWAQRSSTWSWKSDIRRGGGIGALFGTHLYYMAEWLLGPAVRVFASAGKPVCKSFAPDGAQPAEDLLNCVIHHQNGAVWSATIGNANPGLNVHRWIAVFDRGHAILENLSSDYISGFRLVVLPAIEGAVVETGAVDVRDGRIKPFSRLAERFIAAIRYGCAMSPDFRAGARVQLIDELIKASCESGVFMTLVNAELDTA